MDSQTPSGGQKWAFGLLVLLIIVALVISIAALVLAKTSDDDKLITKTGQIVANDADSIMSEFFTKTVTLETPFADTNYVVGFGRGTSSVPATAPIIISPDKFRCTIQHTCAPDPVKLAVREKYAFGQTNFSRVVPGSIMWATATTTAEIMIGSSLPPKRLIGLSFWAPPMNSLSTAMPLTPTYALEFSNGVTTNPVYYNGIVPDVFIRYTKTGEVISFEGIIIWVVSIVKETDTTYRCVYVSGEDITAKNCNATQLDDIVVEAESTLSSSGLLGSYVEWFTGTDAEKHKILFLKISTLKNSSIEQLTTLVAYDFTEAKYTRSKSMTSESQVASVTSANISGTVVLLNASTYKFLTAPLDLSAEPVVTTEISIDFTGYERVFSCSFGLTTATGTPLYVLYLKDCPTAHAHGTLRTDNPHSKMYVFGLSKYMLDATTKKFGAEKAMFEDAPRYLDEPPQYCISEVESPFNVSDRAVMVSNGKRTMITDGKQQFLSMPLNPISFNDNENVVVSCISPITSDSFLALNQPNETGSQGVISNAKIIPFTYVAIGKEKK